MPLLQGRRRDLLRYHGSVISRDTVTQCALNAGFDLAGVAPLPPPEDLEFSRRWVERGYGGDMGYLKNPKRDDPRRILASVRSAICVGLIYNAALPYSTECVPSPAHRGAAGAGSPDFDQANAGSPRAWISRYAWGSDYHSVMRERLERLRKAIEALEPAVETRVYVDTGPLNERALARYSGIGWMGKNTCIINERRGSWFFLGVVLTNLELAPDLPAPDRCGSCTRCIEACPTHALVEPYVMDASRCIAYFTIELRGAIPEEFRPAVGANIFGCDICQDVCPWNSRNADSQAAPGLPSKGAGRTVAATTLAEFQPQEVRISPPGMGAERQGTASKSISLFNPCLEDLISLTEGDFRQAFRKSPIKRAKYVGWLRNLCVAIGNAGDPRFLPWLDRMLDHPNRVVREHALWARRKLVGGDYTGKPPGKLFE